MSGFLTLSFRKIKQDLRAELTEASVAGSILSIAVGLFMVYLVAAQVSEYRSIKTETNVVLDHYSSAVGDNSQDSAEDTLQINFNISFPHLSCEYASVDATNFMGTHDAGLASRVSKVMLDKGGRQIGPFEERKHKVKHTDDMAPLEHKELDRSLKVNIHDFEEVRRRYEVLIVNFYTPWCHWCQKLEPVWDEAAAKIKEQDNDRMLIRFASVDCSGELGSKLCTEKRIDAFPTIMVFRRDDLKDAHHERYHGERSVTSIVNWANHFLDQATNKAPKTQAVDHNADGEADSHIGVGCLIAGLLHVQRAPGGITIQAKSDGHEFNWATMDVSHQVNHISFGPFLTDTAWKVMPAHIAQAVGSLDDRMFSSEQHIPTTHEHMIKIVKNVVELPNAWRIPPVIAHGYVVHSNNIQRFAEVPSVRINYDILPIIVHVQSKFETFYTFLTRLCAILGGVFTITGIVSAGVDAGMASLTKKDRLGKLG